VNRPAEERPIEIETGARPSAAVVWLHGLGADGHDFAGIVPELGLGQSPAVRFVFPHAPFRPVTVNNGYVMRAWYDVGFGPSGFAQDAQHLAESVEIVHALIARENDRGIPAGRVVIAGFSQGGTVALHAGLRYGERLAGIAALSAPVPFIDELVGAGEPANRHVPIFLAHGKRDPVVPFTVGDHAQRVLRANGYPVEWRSYDIEHTVSYPEIRDIAGFLGGILPEPSKP
jgi:phospholipase/carboxylesterase